MVAPGGRTTTQRLGRPSFVVAGESSTSVEAQLPDEEVDGGVVLVDDDADELEMHGATTLALTTDASCGWKNFQPVTS